MTEYLKINGRNVAFKPGQTILEVALDNHIQIPTLCYLKDIAPSTGACRICVVEVEGVPLLVPSCATPATSGMVVKTESERVVTARKTILELLLSSGNHNCAIAGSNMNNWTSLQLMTIEDDGSDNLCPAWGDCKLQSLAYMYQVKGDKHTHTEPHYPMEIRKNLNHLPILRRGLPADTARSG